MKPSILPAWLAALTLHTAAAESPLTPDQALASFRLEPGLRIELVASEPTVVDPVALAFDELGRMFVAENRGYPTGPGEGQPPAGIIALLEDTDGDGRFEKRTVFADGLTFPNGVLPWKGGLFVTCAPDVFYLKDTDGDGRADVRRVVLTGFDAGNTSQLRVSHPTFGPDNWIYLTSGLTGGKIVSPDHPDRAPVTIRSDSRFRPDTLEFEAVDGRAQFGQTFDDLGRRFICMNRVQVQHVVLPSRYLRRNPYLAFSETVENCPEAKSLVASALRTPNAATRIYPISQNITTADSHAGTFTAACGVLIYQGTALPDECYGQAFSCDPTGNLVHRDKLVPAGATFIAERTQEKIEFLASTDDWFRPVFLANGPDGALCVCDMYRKTIEHPQYLPEEIRKRTDFSSGRDRGRIYRVVGEKQRGVNRQPKAIGRGAAINLARLDGKELCEALAHSNGWHRETAQRLIVERKDPAVAAILRGAIADGQSPMAQSAAARVRALHTLDALGALEDESILRGLRDEHPGVRELALQFAEPRLAKSTELFQRALALADDPDARVRFQCALTLGAMAEARVVPALAKIALRDASDRWTRAAVLSSIHTQDGESQIDRFLELVLHSPLSSNEGTLSFLEELGRLRGASSATGLAQTLIAILPAGDDVAFEAQLALLAGLAEGRRSRGGSESGGPIFKALLASNAGSDQTVQMRFDKLCRTAVAVVTSETQPVAARVAAARLLGQADYAPAGEALLKLVDPRAPAAVQTGAVRALGQMADPALGLALLSSERWQFYTPPLRDAVLAAVLSQPRQLPALLTALETEVLPKSILTPA